MNSVAAVELVTDAFTELKREPGLTLADAMRRAMMRSIEAGGARAHPAIWAPFVAVAANREALQSCRGRACVEVIAETCGSRRPVHR